MYTSTCHGLSAEKRHFLLKCPTSFRQRVGVLKISVLNDGKCLDFRFPPPVANHTDITFVSHFQVAPCGDTIAQGGKRRLEEFDQSFLNGPGLRA